MRRTAERWRGGADGRIGLAAVVAAASVMVMAPGPVGAARPPVTTVPFQVRALSDDGRHALGTVYDTVGARTLARRIDRDGGVTREVVIPNGQTATLLSGDGRYAVTDQMRRYELDTGEVVVPTVAGLAQVLAVNGAGEVVVATDDQGGVLVWNTADPVPVRVGDAIPHGTGSAVIHQVALDRAGTHVAVSLSNPVACATAGCGEIWLVDLVAGTSRVVSVGVAGQVGDGSATWPQLSGDGRYLAWVTDAPNLFDGPRTRVSRVVVRDLVTGTIRAVGPAVAAYGLSDDGTRIAFGDDTPVGTGLRVADLATGRVHTPQTLSPNPAYGYPVASRDGSTVSWVDLFSTGSSYIVDPVSAAVVGVPDTRSGSVPAGVASPAPRPVVRLDARDVGAQGLSSAFGYDRLNDLTADGRTAAAGAGPFSDIVDIATGVVLPRGGNQYERKLSGDGRYVVNGASLFDRSARTTVTPTVPDGGTGSIVDVSNDGTRVLASGGFLPNLDLFAGPSDGILTSLTTGLPPGLVTGAALSTDGRTAVFTRRADGTCTTPVACASTVFLADTATGARRTIVDDGTVNAWPVVSGDGRYVAWLSTAVSSRVTNGYEDLDTYRLVHLDTTTGATRTLLTDAAVWRANATTPLSPPPLSMNADGQRLATTRELLASTHQLSVVLVDITTNRVHRLVRDVDNAHARSTDPVLSDDGRTLGFSSGSPRMSAARVQYFMSRSTYAYTLDLSALDTLDDPAGFDPIDAVLEVHAAVPARLLDTRTGTGGHAGRLAAGETLALPVAGSNGVPTGAAAVVANVTAVEPTAAGFLTVYPCGTERPTASNVNYRTGDIIPNLTITKLATDGTICIYAHQPTDIVIDLAGWFPAGSTYRPTVPARLVDTRTGTGGHAGRLAAGATLTVAVAGSNGVPTGAAAVVANVTAVEPTAAGFLTVYPCGTERPTASNVNYRTGDIIPNLTITKLATDGTICIYAHQPTDIVIDLAGWFPAGSTYRPTVPARLVDTRTGTGGHAGRLAAGATLTVAVAGSNGVPTGAAAVVANVTAVEPTAAGFLTVYPCGTERPTASNVNYRTGDIIPNLTITKLATDGTICIYAHQPTDIVIDLAGWFPAD